MILELPDLKENEEYDDLKLSEQARVIKELKTAIGDIESIKRLFTSKYDYITMNVVPDKMDEEDIRTISYDGVGRLQTSAVIQCSVLKGNQDKLKDWLIEHNHSSIIKDTINSSTLKSWVRGQMELEANYNPKEGEEPPEFYPKELINIFIGSRATVVNT